MCKMQNNNKKNCNKTDCCKSLITEVYKNCARSIKNIHFVSFICVPIYLKITNSQLFPFDTKSRHLTKNFLEFLIRHRFVVYNELKC